MLEFNQEHVGADLSQIKSKTSKAKNAGKVMLAGAVLSSVILLSGCDNSNAVTNEQPSIEQPVITSSAIIMENGNAMIVDVTEVRSFRVYSSAYSPEEGGKFEDSERTYALRAVSGDELIVNYDSFKLVSGENSHEKAETIAQSLISENGQITCYDEVETFGKTR